MYYKCTPEIELELKKDIEIELDIIEIINFEKYQIQTTNGTSINTDISRNTENTQTTLNTTVVQL
jgi:hypothetical protein